MKKAFLIYLLLLSVATFGQKRVDPSKNKIFSCEEILKAGDIEYALDVGIVESRISLKCSPKGAGEKIEVASGRKRDENYFEKEHNVVWIKFTTGKSANLSFRIRPISEKDDYDFLLFKITGDNTPQQIYSKKLAPIRSNIARNKKENKGITGLNASVTNTHAYSGPRSQFSKSIRIKKGDEYYLVLDNVYNNGEGAIIYFDYFFTKKISGYINNDDKENKEFLGAEISWEDAKTGKVLAKTVSDSLTGYYEMEVPIDTINPTKKYVLSAYTKEHFFAEKTFTAKEIINHKSPSINLLLPKLKKGLRNPLQSINFHGNSPKFLPSAYPSLKRLKKLMQKNKSLKILIEGHTNGCGGGVSITQKLSEDRATSVKDFLITNGITEDRMDKIGWNCKHMLYPDAISTNNLKQQELNRRVEILVLDY